MTYKDAGYDSFLNRPVLHRSSMTEADSSLFMGDLTGSNISGGKTISGRGKLIINWDTGEVIIRDGAYSRVLMGYIAEEDAYGIKIRNASGEVIFTAAGQLATAGIAAGAVTDVKITSVAAEKILAGDLVVAMDIGDPASGYIRLDGPNNRMVVNDGSDDRIVIGDI